MKNSAALGCMGVVGVLVGSIAWGQEEKPWALRDHYEVKYGPTAFVYDVNTSEWQIEIDGIGEIFRNVQSEVILADGRRLRLADQKMRRDERETFEDNFGKGTFFRSVYESEIDLSIRYSIKQFSNRAFIHLQMELRNDGFVPLEIAVIRPAVMERGAITPAAQQAKLESLHVAQRGGLPTLDDTTEPTLIRMEFDSPRTAVGIGILPFGATEPSVVLDRSEEQWVGSVGVRFTPPLSLPPGASVRSDPVWLGVDDGISNYIRESYSWCHTVSPSARRSVDAPTSWVTMASNDPVDRLYDSARAWQRHDVNAALVPSSWERERGTLRPKTPQYPSDIREVVSALRAIGMETGVVYDPLAAGDAKAGTILTAANGSRWFAPSDRRAIEAAAAHVAKLTSLGFSFYVVEPSVIPDDVLKQAGITRQEADMFAFGVLTQVAGDSPVIPSASMSLGNEPARWRAAADATAGYAKLQLLPAPIQLDAAQLTEVTPALVDSIGAFEGPIEILGIPDARVQRELGPALARGEWLGKVGVSSTVQHADSGD